MNKENKPKVLSPEQHYVLRGEGTEHPGSSPLNKEKREGTERKEEYYEKS